MRLKKLCYVYLFNVLGTMCLGYRVTYKGSMEKLKQIYSIYGRRLLNYFHFISYYVSFKSFTLVHKSKKLSGGGIAHLKFT